MTEMTLPQERTRVAVRYFAAAAEATGREEEELLVDGNTLGDLKAQLTERYGDGMSAVLRTGSFLVDGVVRRDPAHRLGARVDVLPPFAGG